MPFGLQAITSSGTYSLSAGTPYSLESATGMWMAPIRRVTDMGPFQDGDTDRGFRLDPRISTLSLNFVATSGSALDTYRDTLMSIFRPTTSTPVKLRLTRDDGGVRQLDCYTVGPVDVPLQKENKPGNLHRAVVQLRAGDPGWYDPTPGTVAVTGTASLSATWYLAGGLIGSANVMEYGSTPSQGQNWTYTGTRGSADPYSIVFRSSPETLSGTKHAFYVDNATSDVTFSTGTSFYTGGSSYNVGAFPVGSAAMGVSPGTGNYMLVAQGSASYVSGTVYWNKLRLYSYRPGNGIMPNFATHEAGLGVDITGSTRKWRSGPSGGNWSNAIERYAVYDIALSEVQRDTLNAFMTGAIGGTISSIVNVTYAGDLPEYPVITITGPLSNGVITNTVTGKTINLGGMVLLNSYDYVIDLRYGRKMITFGTSVLTGEIDPSSDLDDWALVPSPLAPGGTNSIVLSGDGAGVGTRIEIVYYNRYAGF